MPTVPEALVALVISGAEPEMVNTMGVLVLLPLAFVAVTAALKTPTALGVPEISPVVADIVIPVGKPFAE